jgi:uncharacterized SAM-binding protein YcdF (DUF218 family)
MLITRLFWTLVDNPPSETDCFVIPSYALKSRSLPTRPTRAQIRLAYLWWQRFPQASLIMSTGDNQGLGVTNAAVMADYAVSLGVPAASIVQEDRSHNTFENLWYSREIVRAQGWRRPTLVTLDLYTRRAVATARKQGWEEFYWVSALAKGEPAHGYKALQTYSRLTIFCYEMAAMAYSGLRGWV